MPQILKDTQVVSDNWILLDENCMTAFPLETFYCLINSGKISLTTSADHSGRIGIWLEGHAEIEQIIEPLLNLPLIAINFPKFADGRGFSCGKTN